jgi:hypothetical protein
MHASVVNGGMRMHRLVAHESTFSLATSVPGAAMPRKGATEAKGLEHLPFGGESTLTQPAGTARTPVAQ